MYHGSQHFVDWGVSLKGQYPSEELRANELLLEFLACPWRCRAR